LETIREYGLECLAASGEMEIVRQAHAIYYQALARKAVSHLHSSGKRRWLDQLEQEQDNLRSVLNGLLAQGEAEQFLRLGNDLFWFWLMCNYPREWRSFLERGLAAQGSVPCSVTFYLKECAGLNTT
jgi:predicted ATPase